MKKLSFIARSTKLLPMPPQNLLGEDQAMGWGVDKGHASILVNSIGGKFSSSEIISGRMCGPGHLSTNTCRAYCVPGPRHIHNSPMSEAPLSLSADGDTGLRRLSDLPEVTQQ